MTWCRGINSNQWWKPHLFTLDGNNTYVPRYPFCHRVRSPHGMNPKPSTSPIARIIDLVGQTKPKTRRELQGYQIMQIINQQIGSRQTHRQRGLHRIDLHEDHGELCIEDPRERRNHLATNYGPVGLKWTTHESLEGRWCWWRSPPTPKSPPAGHREGSPDEISRNRKLAAAEKCFRGLIFSGFLGNL